MNAEKHMQMMQMLNGVVVNKYVSHEDYEELEVSDEHGNKMEIKFYPNEEEQ
ncbi:hypothetical protein ACUW9V_000897 [Staphylococcus epidermidis]|uniref:hypothetical protein n=1 Tax=Staphylococcus TaxID=1279 RepID=UPI0002FEB8A6|nr:MULTISPECIES: hypothetical protein [Staphylococcus]MBC2966001.1 hypothetical protein [Staphylococcus epidermidis]MBC3110164.1 hypothetical protein [Staphylococcus epidermidis]MCG2212794.1 hypothetical protein [Staphylococcus epidermidis]MDS3993952.1 hypothetical protein [Staphylococcus capitis]